MTRYFGKICEKHPELNGERLCKTNHCMGCKREYENQAYRRRMENPEYRAKRSSASVARSKQNPEKRRNIYNKWSAGKRKTDPIFRIRRKLSTYASKILVAINTNKRSSFTGAIGLSPGEFKSYIESKFTDGMSWDNRRLWHIDHIVPLSSANTEEELIKLCHHSNLQPLWALDNILKSDKY